MKGVENVYQLSGGIHRYLEQIPAQESLFKGKNFVFDVRGSMSNHIMREEEKVGTCVLCSSSHDEYRNEYRCHSCRTLLLVCQSCTGVQCSLQCQRCSNGGMLDIGL